MNSKMNTLTSAILIGFATSAFSAEPLSAPSIYDNGAQELSINMSAAEMAAYALYESAMQVVEAIVLASSCTSAAGSYAFSIAADGSIGTPASNQISILLPGGSEAFVLGANLLISDPNRGQLLNIEQLGNGALNKIEFNGYSSQVAFNHQAAMMDSASRVNVKGVNGSFDSFQGKVIKDFYSDPNPGAQLPYIFDWGLQDISKLGYPENRYWQRSKSLRDDGVAGHTVFVKDRLTGSSTCRIVMEGSGSNSQDFFQQTGALTISKEKPSDPVPAFEAF
ncbi:MAG: hypothetical protein QX198_05860 [Methylococcaceae bacterium]